MPKKNKHSRDGTTVDIHSIVNTTITGNNIINLNPSNMSSNGGSTRILTVADNWAQYRVVSLRFRLHPVVAANTAQAAGWVSGIQDTPPATTATTMELIPSCFLSNYQQVPTKWVNVSKADLAGPLPWYKSVLGAADATEESPGVIVVNGTGANTYYLEILATYEFKGGVAPANTPEALAMLRRFHELKAAKELLCERQRLLGIIGYSAPRLAPVVNANQVPGL